MVGLLERPTVPRALCYRAFAACYGRSVGLFENALRTQKYDFSKSWKNVIFVSKTAWKSVRKPEYLHWKSVFYLFFVLVIKYNLVSLLQQNQVVMVKRKAGSVFENLVAQAEEKVYKFDLTGL